MSAKKKAAREKAPEEQKVSPAEEWSVAKPDAIPPPTFVPAAMAFGTSLFMWGLLTSVVLIAVGLSVMVVSMVGWIGEMRHD
jgi:hypothetical protein